MKKSLTIILTVVLLFNVVAFSTINVAAHQPDPPIKLYNYIDTYTAEELELLTSNPDDYYVSVFVSFNYSKMDSRELDELEKSTRLDLIRNYYGTRNLLLANELGIPTDTVSLYTPFAELSYATLAEYEQNENFIYGLAESVDVAFVEISVKKNETHGTKADFASQTNYVWDLYTDHMGLTTTTTYTGAGVKVGFLEKSIVAGMYYIEDDLMTQNGGFSMTDADRDHAFSVVTLAAGYLGIAEDADCYVSSLHNTTWRAALEWLINNNVDIINISVGDTITGGVYNQLAAYIDYLIDTTDTLMIVATGAEKAMINPNTNMSSPAIAANALTVGSINTDKKVFFAAKYSTHSNANATGTNRLSKPDLVAPGENICVPDIDEPQDGSSYAAAFVTGLTAKLLQEYPTLKNNAHLLKAVLTASCEWLPDQTTGQDPYAGAGLINYEHARTIMRNHQYQTQYKYYDVSDGTYLGYLSVPQVSAGHRVIVRYVIPVSGVWYSSPNDGSPISLEAFSKFGFCPVNTITQSSSYYITPTNTGFVPCPVDTVRAMQYDIDIFIEENNSDTEDEDIVIAYRLT